MRDGYKIFFDHFNIDDDSFMDLGIKSIITEPSSNSKTRWNELKQKISDGGQVHIRRYGAQGANSPLIQDIYSEVFPNLQIAFDRNNNTEPKKLVLKETGWSKTSKKVTEKLKRHQERRRQERRI